MDRFTVSTEDVGGVRVVTMLGELDLAAAEDVRGVIASGLEGAREIRVDCAGVTFVDSIGIKALLHLLTSCGERRLAVAFVFSPVVERVLGTLGIAERFPTVVAA